MIEAGLQTKVEGSAPYNPPTATADLHRVLRALAIDEHGAAHVVQQLVDQGRKPGLQIFLSIEPPESALPEVHLLTNAILSLPQQDNIYYTPTAHNYNGQKFYQLFGFTLD